MEPQCSPPTPIGSPQALEGSDISPLRFIPSRLKSLHSDAAELLKNEFQDAVAEIQYAAAERVEYAVTIALAEGRHGVRVAPDGRAYPSGTVAPGRLIYEPRGWS